MAFGLREEREYSRKHKCENEQHPDAQSISDFNVVSHGQSVENKYWDYE